MVKVLDIVRVQTQAAGPDPTVSLAQTGLSWCYCCNSWLQPLASPQQTFGASEVLWAAGAVGGRQNTQAWVERKEREPWGEVAAVGQVTGLLVSHFLFLLIPSWLWCFIKHLGGPISHFLIVGFSSLCGEPTHLERSISPLALLCTGGRLWLQATFGLVFVFIKETKVIIF